MSKSTKKTETKAPPRKLSDIEFALSELLKQYEASDKKTPANVGNYDMNKARATTLKAIRIETDNAHTVEKAPHLEAGRRVDAEKKTILNIIKPVELKYTTAYKAIDKEKERVKAEQVALEKQRLDGIQALLDEIDAMGMLFDIPDIEAAIKKLETLNLQLFQERSEDAEAKKDTMLSMLQKRLDALKKQVEQAEKLKADREALDKQKAELAEREKAVEAQQAEVEPVKSMNTPSVGSNNKKPARQATNATADNAELLRNWFLSLHELPEINENDTEATETRSRLMESIATMDVITSEFVSKVKTAA